jgi:hypothetical protein
VLGFLKTSLLYDVGQGGPPVPVLPAFAAHPSQPGKAMDLGAVRAAANTSITKARR